MKCQSIDIYYSNLAFQIRHPKIFNSTKEIKTKQRTNDGKKENTDLVSANMLICLSTLLFLHRAPSLSDTQKDGNKHLLLPSNSVLSK